MKEGFADLYTKMFIYFEKIKSEIFQNIKEITIIFFFDFESSTAKLKKKSVI